MFKRLLMILLGISLSLVSVGQSSYSIGYGEASLEPVGDFLSVALQGYGHPPQGRFTLEWRGLESVDINEPLSFTGGNKGLYALAHNGDLYCRNMASSEWSDVGATNPVVLLAGSSPDSYKLLTGDGDILYGVSLLNELYRYDTTQAPMKWNKIAAVPDAVAMAACDGRLYIVSADGVLHEGCGNERTFTFKEIAKVPGTSYSMVAFRGRLYVLLDNQSIWEYDLSDVNPWRMVAYLNGVTYKEPLRFLAIHHNVLYGMGFDNKLFEAASRTEGNISVRTLAVNDGKNTVVISGMDLGAIDYDFAMEIKKEVASRTGISTDNMLMNISHSHFTPVSKNWYAFGDSGIADRRYLEKVKQAYIYSVEKSLTSMKQGTISFARTTVDVGYNRGLSGADSVVDKSLDVAVFDIKSESECYLLFENACHPVFPNAGRERYTISANWPGTAREAIEKALPDVKSIYLQGCAGDINPLSQDYKVTGREVANRVIDAVNAEMTPVRGKIRVKCGTVEVPVKVMSEEEVRTFMKTNMHRTGDIEAQKNVRWAEYMLELYRNGNVPHTLPVHFQIFDIGDWRIVGLSREPVTEYALKIRALWPRKRVTVLGYTGDVSSYLTSDVHLRAGNYESLDSFFWYASPSHFPEGSIDMIIEKIGEAVK